MDLIGKINGLFLESNKLARLKIINEVPVILLLNRDDLTLMRYGKIVATKGLQLKDYHTIKSVCHYISGRIVGHIIDDSLMNQVSEFIKDNRQIFEFSGVRYWCGLIEMINSNKMNYDVLGVAMKHAAVTYQLELHRLVQELKSTVDPDEWNQLLVIITGPPSPRPGHSANQYFSRLTGKPDLMYQPSTDDIEYKHNRKLYYVENVYDIPQILEIVAQLWLERVKYDEVIDMRTDILAYDTDEYLKKVCKN